MKDLRPLGSEKLTGDDKIKRILEIANYGRTQKPSVNVDKPEYITESKNGGIYGIVKEKDGFYVKKGLNESSLEYIGGMFMKNKNKFTSYGEAFKRLDYLIGQESLQEATKYILKQTKTPEVKPMEAAPAEPSMSELPPMDAPAPEGEMPPSGDVPPTGAEGEPSPEGGEGQLRSSYMANIQKFAGKLGQELRDQKDKLESDDLKYVLNMVISAVDLDMLDDDDFEEIADKFDPEKRKGGEDGGIPSIDDGGVPEPEQEVAEENDTIYDGYGEEEEVDEIMNSLEEFINSPVEDDEDSTNSLMRQYSDLDGNDEEDMSEEFSSMDLPMEKSEEITKKGKIYFNDKKNRYEFISNPSKDSYGQNFKYLFYIDETNGHKYLEFKKLIDRVGDGNFTSDMHNSSSPLDHLPDWMNKHFSKEIDILKYYSDEDFDDEDFDDEDTLDKYRDVDGDSKYDERPWINKNDIDEVQDNIDWESKLRGKSEKEVEENDEVYPRRTTRRNTYPEPTVSKPQLDIDEIAKAINQALSKYR